MRHMARFPPAVGVGVLDHKRFSLGLHPVSLGKTKEMGWNWQHQRKETQNKTASCENKTPRGNMTPRRKELP